MKAKLLLNFAPSDKLDPALRFEKWETLDLISKTRLVTFLQVLLQLLLMMIYTHHPHFLQTPPLKRSRQDCDLLSSLLRGDEFEQIRSSQRGLFSAFGCAGDVASP
jgi:hypothetical protein